MEDALVPSGGDSPKGKERPLLMADRAHVNLPNRKPPWWSTAEYGIPMNYGQRASRPTPGGRKLLTMDEVAGNEETGLVKHAPGTVDLAKKAKKELAMLDEERRIDPNRLDELEKTLRNEVARHTPYHERKYTILVRAFQTFDHEKKGTIPLDAFRRALQCFNVEVTPAEGRALFRKFGQDGQRRLPYQVFARALFTTKARLLAWTNVHSMNTRGKNGLPKGAPFIASANKEQKAVDRLFDAKIQPFSAGPGHCVTGLYPPSNWATDTWETNGLVHPVVRARHPPDAEIDLDHVYGYNGVSVYSIVDSKAGKNQQIDPISSVVSPNLFYTSTRGIVYSTAALGVILEWEEEGGALSSVKQRFFQAHTEGILCLKLDESRNYCATGQRPTAKTGAGEVCDPFVSVWDMNSMQELMQLPHKPSKPEKPTDPVDPIGGIQAVCFSEDGSLVISCARNPAATVFVWQWRQQLLLWRKDTKSSVPPAIFGCKWNRVEKADGSRHFDFCTFGMKHINFFKEDPKAPNPKGHLRMYVAEAGSFVNKQDPKADPKAKDVPQVQDVMCVEFLANGNVVSGMASGDIYLWKPMATSHGMQCDKILMIPGADPTKPKVKAHLHTVQVLKIRFVRSSSGDAIPTLLSGGGGGKIKVWKDLDGEVPIFTHEIELPKKQGERAVVPSQVPIGFNGTGQPPAIKALDCFPGADDLVVGTDKCDVYKIKLVAKPDGTFEPAVPTLLVKGHTDDVNAIDVHPKREYLFASAAMSDMVYLWDANLKSLVGQVSLKGRRGTCCAFRGDAKHLAIGTYDGCVFIFRELNDWEGDSLRLQKVPEMGIWPLRDCTQAIQELKYSPDLRTLAVSSHDQMVDLYDCADGRYVRLKRCQGHSATVSHMDWAVDSRILQSQCNAYEILYWNTDRGEPADGWEIGQPSPFSDPRKRRKFGLQVTEEQRDTKWETWSCKFGFDVMGIWPSGYINTSIKMVARSPRLESNGPNPKQMLAAVDDKGNMMVFNYPTVVYRQPMHSHPGHASFVMNVRWLSYKDENGVDQLMLVTAGGHDRSLMQWRVKKLTPPKIDDPGLLKNEGQLMEAKKAWYYKYTGQEWSGEDGIYTKYENIYNGNVGPKEGATGGKGKKELEDKGGSSGGGKASGGADLNSASAVDLQSTIKKQEAELARQNKLIQDLQAQLQGKS